MKIEIEKLNSYLLGAALLLLLLHAGRPLLVPLVFALMLWGVLNAFAELLQRVRVPAALAWIVAFASIATFMYLMISILSTEAYAMAQCAADGGILLHSLLKEHPWIRHVIPSLDLGGGETYAMRLLGEAIGSIGGVLADAVLVSVYVGFLLTGQRSLPPVLAGIFRGNNTVPGERTVRMIGRGIRRYLGVCSLLSVVMGLVSYALLTGLGLRYAGFWALVMFLLTFIPVVGAAGAALPALMALLQFHSIGPAMLVLIVLSLCHFLLTDVIETVILGYSLNLNPFVMVVALTFWGLLWGIAGLFLAVPLTAAFAIACRHLVGLEWLADLMQGTQAWHAGTPAGSPGAR